MPSRKIPLETRTCICGNTFKCKVNSKRKFCCSGHSRLHKFHTQEAKDKIRKALTGRKGKKQSQETKDKIAKANTGKKRTQATKDKISKSNIGKHSNIRTQEHKDKISKSNIGKKHTQEAKDKIRKALKGKKKTQEHKDKMQESHLEQWKDPKYRESQLKAMSDGAHVSPNNQEKYLFKIIDKLFPNQYLLNTKGEHTRPNNKRPDIVNLKDKKLIEFYGDHPHANLEFCKLKGITEVYDIPVQDIRKRDKIRLDSFRELGWSPLVIWHHELKDLDKLTNKLCTFHYN